MSLPTVYIIDDDDAVRGSLRALLESYEFEVEDFASATEFLAQYSDGRNCCLVLDMHLPQLSGIETLTRLRQNDRSHLPVLLITGRGDRQVKGRALAAGATLYLEKPVNADRLVAEVQALTAH